MESNSALTRNVQISLAQHWSVFSHLKGEKTTSRKWRGPEGAASPPYDIMCPTPPRGKEEEEHFNSIVKDLVSKTDLSVPRLERVSGENVGDLQAVDLVMKGEARVAMVSELSVNLEVKTLLVELCLDVELPRNSNVETLKICRTGGGGYSLAESWCGDSLIQLVVQHLLPEAYLLQPELVVVGVGQEVQPSNLESFVFLLQSLAAGRMIIIQK